METDLIHDDPLGNYPGVIATLIRQRTLKIVKQQLAAKGVWIGHVTQADLVRFGRSLLHGPQCRVREGSD
jgi:hypothetical protein